jgi:membrane-bound lytic murein transglycosylase D
MPVYVPIFKGVQSNKMKLSLTRIMFVTLALASSAIAGSLDLPIEGLESRVEFWKKVFTQYGADDIIIHDRMHVNLIYDIADESNVKSKTSAVKLALQEIRENLQTVENLSLTAKQIHAAIIENGVTMSASSLDNLIDNIHTQRGIKERFRQGIIRSGRYAEDFRGIFEQAGVPAEIALLPLVESSFENRAFSKAGAAGIWQFMRSTGRLYLKVTSKVDERLDPAKATRAAARLLNDNYRALQSWPLAITAYNHGKAGMMRAQDAHGSDITEIIANYEGKTFGYASMNFYAEFLAAVDVYKSYPQYFGELTLDKPVKAVPRAAAPAVTQSASTSGNKYRVRSGDTLWEIAQRFGTSIRDLMEKNNLNKTAIYAGQMLLVN